MDPRASQSTVLRTPLCDLLGVRYPIVQAGMAGGPTTPEMVAAVSNAGGLGVLGAARLAPDQLREAIRAIKAQTNQPCGVNFLLAPPESGSQDVPTVQHFLDHFRQELQIPLGRTDLTLPPSRLPQQLEIVFDEQVPVLSVGLGDPSKLTAAAHAAGSRVMAMVTTVEEAMRVVEGGLMSSWPKVLRPVVIALPLHLDHMVRFR